MLHVSPSQRRQRMILMRALPRGFTLIELLVVIAIIALLISILLPSLARAREQARVSACASMIRQMGNSSHMYADSNRNTHVGGWASWDQDPGGMHADSPYIRYSWFWNDAWAEIMGMEGQGWWEAPIDYLCPNAPSEEWGGRYSDHELTRATDPYPGHIDHVYGYNTVEVRWYGETDPGFETAQTIPRGGYFPNRDDIRRPSTIPQFTDATMWEYGGLGWELDPVNGWYAQFGDMSTPRVSEQGLGDGSWAVAYRHMQEEGANLGKFDGSVSYTRKDDAFPLDWDARVRMWVAYPNPETGEPAAAGQ